MLPDDHSFIKKQIEKNETITKDYIHKFASFQDYQEQAIEKYYDNIELQKKVDDDVQRNKSLQIVLNPYQLKSEILTAVEKAVNNSTISQNARREVNEMATTIKDSLPECDNEKFYNIKVYEDIIYSDEFHLLNAVEDPKKILGVDPLLSNAGMNVPRISSNDPDQNADREQRQSAKTYAQNTIYHDEHNQENAIRSGSLIKQKQVELKNTTDDKQKNVIGAEIKETGMAIVKVELSKKYNSKNFMPNYQGDNSEDKEYINNFLYDRERLPAISCLIDRNRKPKISTEHLDLSTPPLDKINYSNYTTGELFSTSSNKKDIARKEIRQRCDTINNFMKRCIELKIDKISTINLAHQLNKNKNIEDLEKAVPNIHMTKEQENNYKKYLYAINHLRLQDQENEQPIREFCTMSLYHNKQNQDYILTKSDNKDEKTDYYKNVLKLYEPEVQKKIINIKMNEQKKLKNLIFENEQVDNQANFDEKIKLIHEKTNAYISNHLNNSIEQQCKKINVTQKCNIEVIQTRFENEISDIYLENPNLENIEQDVKEITNIDKSDCNALEKLTQYKKYIDIYSCPKKNSEKKSLYKDVIREHLAYQVLHTISDIDYNSIQSHNIDYDKEQSERNDVYYDTFSTILHEKNFAEFISSTRTQNLYKNQEEQIATLFAKIAIFKKDKGKHEDYDLEQRLEKLREIDSQSGKDKALLKKSHNLIMQNIKASQECFVKNEKHLALLKKIQKIIPVDKYANIASSVEKVAGYTKSMKKEGLEKRPAPGDLIKYTNEKEAEALIELYEEMKKNAEKECTENQNLVKDNILQNLSAYFNESPEKIDQQKIQKFVSFLQEKTPYKKTKKEEVNEDAIQYNYSKIQTTYDKKDLLKELSTEIALFNIHHQIRLNKSAMEGASSESLDKFIGNTVANNLTPQLFFVQYDLQRYNPYTYMIQSGHCTSDYHDTRKKDADILAPEVIKILQYNNINYKEEHNDSESLSLPKELESFKEFDSWAEQDKEDDEKKQNNITIVDYSRSTEEINVKLNQKFSKTLEIEDAIHKNKNAIIINHALEGNINDIEEEIDCIKQLEVNDNSKTQFDSNFFLNTSDIVPIELHPDNTEEIAKLLPKGNSINQNRSGSTPGVPTSRGRAS